MFKDVVEEYLKLYPKDKNKIEPLIVQLESRETLDRSNRKGHITGSAFILSPDFKKILVVHHTVLELWLQPGGHWETAEKGPWETARREAVEETSVHLARTVSVDKDHRIPLALQSHFIPANPSKNEPEHYHHDFKYGFVAKDEQIDSGDTGIKAMKWVTLDSPEARGIGILVTRLQELLKENAPDRTMKA